MRSRFHSIETLRRSGVPFEEAYSIKPPIQSLEVVSVVLVKVPTESGGVVLIPACSGEISGHFSFSSTATSRLGHDR